MMHVECFDVTYPPIFICFKASSGVVLLKSVKFARYRGFGVFVFDGH